MNHIPFSVAMCVYAGDNPNHFRTAVESIFNQTVPPNEVVLVVDGPVTDKLNATICEYEDIPIFHVIRLKENQGHGNARRIGLEHCQYDLVALMDADDISISDRFEKQLLVFMNKPEVSVVGGNIREFTDTPENTIAKRAVPTEDVEIKRFMKKRCPFNQMTVMFRKNAIQRAGGYIDWYCNEDYYLWIRLYQDKAVFCNVDEALVYVRVCKDMYRRRGGLKYFVSEAKLQKYMLDQEIITLPLYCMNVLKRLVVQVLMPNRLRGLVFRKFARESVS